MRSWQKFLAAGFAWLQHWLLPLRTSRASSRSEWVTVYCKNKISLIPTVEYSRAKINWRMKKNRDETKVGPGTLQINSYVSAECWRCPHSIPRVYLPNCCWWCKGGQHAMTTDTLNTSIQTKMPEPEQGEDRVIMKTTGWWVLAECWRRPLLL